MANGNSIDEISFRLAIEAGRIGTWRRDLATDLIVQSPIATEILGHGHGETVIPFEYLFTYTHQDDLAKFGQALEPEIESGEPFDLEFRIWRPDGKLRWITIRGKSIKNDAGRPVQVVGVMFDITEKKQATERFRLLTEYSPDAILVESNHRIVYANPVALRLLGAAGPEDVLDQSLLDFACPESHDAVVSAYKSISEKTPASNLCDLKIKRAGGSVADAQAVFGFLYWDGQPATQLMIRDMTALKTSQRKIQQLSSRLSSIVEGTGDGIWEWDIPNNTFRFSGGFNKIIGRGEARAEAITFDWFSIIHPEDASKVRQHLDDSVKKKIPLHGCEFRIRSASGEWKWVRARGAIVEEDKNGQPLVMAGTLTDITIRDESDELAWKHANLDSLTALPNHRLFIQRLQYDIQKCKHGGRELALLFIDLDGFKFVNDLYGHDAGDMVLIESARRIKGYLAEEDTLGRLGADEFVVTLPNLTRIEHVEMVCQDLLAALAQPFNLGSKMSYVSASIGISLYPFDATDAEDLIRKADQAKVDAKRSGKNRFAYFTKELDESAHERLRIMNELRLALGASQFEVHYQPVVNFKTGKIVKAEALLRWNHPSMGQIPPSIFVPLAEEFGLIIPIGEWMCRQAVKFCKDCEPAFGDKFQVGINISPIQFMSDNGSLDLSGYLADNGLSGDNVIVEITEGVLLNASDKVLARLDDLRRANIQVALDDFGTGYSSMSYLHKFDIDYIKIDRSFVHNVTTSPDSRAIAETIIAMAHRLNKKVIAEGVETRQQLDYLVQAGCDYGQGYLFSHAVPAQKFIQLAAAPH